MTGTELVLLTTSLPFGVGEEFLEDELPYLAQRFEQLTLVPLSATGAVRQVPQGVRVNSGLARSLQRIARPQLSAAAVHTLLRDVWNQRPVALHPRSLARAARYLARARRIQRWLMHTLDPDRPTLCYAYWLGPAALAACWLRATHPKLVVVARAHGADLYRARHAPPYIPLQRTLLASLNRVYAISEHGLGTLTALAPEASQRFRLSRLGTPEPRTRCEPSSDGTLRIVSCSNTAAVKRLPLLVAGLRALSRLAPAQTIHWCHLGGGADHERFVRHARAQLEGRVQLDLPGQMPHRSISEYYATHAVDVFINVSASEGLPVSIMEAQSFGIPVAATAVGGTPELVNERNGWLMPAEPSPELIARTLLSATHRSASELGIKRQCAHETWRALVNARDNYTRFARELEGLTEHPADVCAT